MPLRVQYNLLPKKDEEENLIVKEEEEEEQVIEEMAKAQKLNFRFPHPEKKIYWRGFSFLSNYFKKLQENNERTKVNRKKKNIVSEFYELQQKGEQRTVERGNKNLQIQIANL